MYRIGIKKFVVILIVLMLVNGISGCSSLEGDGEKVINKYTITLEILNTNKTVISNVELSIENTDYLAEEIEGDTYIFENIGCQWIR